MRAWLPIVLLAFLPPGPAVSAPADRADPGAVGSFWGPGSTPAPGYVAEDCDLKNGDFCGRWDRKAGADPLWIDGEALLVGVDSWCPRLWEGKADGRLLTSFRCAENGPGGGARILLAVMDDPDQAEAVRAMRLFSAQPGPSDLDQLLCLLSVPDWGDDSRPRDGVTCATTWEDLVQPRDMREARQRIVEDVLPTCDIATVQICGWWDGGGQGGGDLTLYGTRLRYQWTPAWPCTVLGEESVEGRAYLALACTEEDGRLDRYFISVRKGREYDKLRLFSLDDERWEEEIACLRAHPAWGHIPAGDGPAPDCGSYGVYSRPSVMTAWEGR